MDANKYQVIMDINGVKKRLLELGLGESYLNEMIARTAGNVKLKTMDVTTLQKVMFKLQDQLDYMLLQNFQRKSLE